MQQPPGFIDPLHPTHVCRLHKSLYGLKQAPRSWYEELYHSLLGIGFVSSSADPSLFIKTDTTLTFILVYVDDILITGNSLSYCQSLIHQLSSQFSMKNLGPIHYFLGIQVQRTTDSIFLSQSKYLHGLLAKAHMLDAKPCSTPSSTTKHETTTNSLMPDPTTYHSLVKALQYLTWTRPNIALAVNQTCQHMHQPTTQHFTTVKRTLRYLKGTPDNGLKLTKGHLLLTAFFDANWAGCSLDRRSTTGFCVFFGSNLISWCAKKQSTVARSSTESEYRALAQTAAEITWICSLLKNLHLFLHQPPLLLCDNISALALSAIPIFHARTKHIEVDYHYIRESVTSRAISIRHVSTNVQLADIFTKSLPKARFKLLNSKLIASVPGISLRGGNNAQHQNTLATSTTSQQTQGNARATESPSGQKM